MYDRGGGWAVGVLEVLAFTCLLLSVSLFLCAQCLCECIYDIGISSEMGQAIWVMGVGIEGVGWVWKFY